MDYSPLIVEIDVKVLVKEERRLEVILAAVPPLQSSSSGTLQPLYFNIFYLRLHSLQNKFSWAIYRGF
jgi:hypothetical protein